MQSGNQGIDREGCIKLVVIATIWTLLLMDINIVRHLTGAAALLDCSIGLLLTLSILYLRFSRRK